MSDVRPPIAGTKQVLVDFPGTGASGEGTTTSCTVVHRPFLPMGLLFWGATDETFVTRIQSGVMSEGSLSGEGRIPARLFETDRSLTELRRLAELGELSGAVDARSVIEMEALPVGGVLSVGVQGPLRTLLAWGYTHVDGYPFTEVSIEPEPSGVAGSPAGAVRATSFTGVVTEHTLGGLRVRCRVRALHVDAVASLLMAFAPSRPSFRL